LSKLVYYTIRFKRFMGISAELLVGDKPITFDEFKATQTNHIVVYISKIV